MNKRIHVVGAGGVAGIGMTRCLKQEKDWIIQGHDSGPYGEYVMECEDERQESLHYCDLIIPVPDEAILKYTDHANTFLPPKEIIELCQDKARLAKALGIFAPKTYWVRDTKGAGGQGAQMASEFLPGRNYSCELFILDGFIKAYFVKERLAYDIKGSKNPLIQRGSSVVSICVRRPDIEDLAHSAMMILSGCTEKKLQGFFGIDFKENEQGKPKITEINAGRLLTASYVYFYTTPYNLALAGIKAFFNEKYVLEQYPAGWGIIRQTDMLPRLFSPEITKKWR